MFSFFDPPKVLNLGFGSLDIICDLFFVICYFRVIRDRIE